MKTKYLSLTSKYHQVRTSVNRFGEIERQLEKCLQKQKESKQNRANMCMTLLALLSLFIDEPIAEKFNKCIVVRATVGDKIVNFLKLEEGEEILLVKLGGIAQ